MGGLFEIEEKEKRLVEINKELETEGIWNNIEYSNKLSKELNTLQKQIILYNDIKDIIIYLNEYIKEIDKKTLNLEEITEEIISINNQLEELETATYLNEEYDSQNCYLEIHPGAGGTESCDWASMLARMYQRYCDKEGYKYEIISEQKGDEAGLKEITMLIKGEYAYGYLKCETGVHRLVRNSPFDSNDRRHTSFSSVMVTPNYDNDINIEIKENELKIDVYRSSGAGGQSVNTTDSAVRITHLPTGTVVTCQNERSQIKNKEQALKILKNKLYQLELINQQEKLKDVKGKMMNIDFGSQIRNYVLEPYTLIKDTRSGYETTQSDKVLNGDIKEIIKSILRTK